MKPTIKIVWHCAQDEFWSRPCFLLCATVTTNIDGITAVYNTHGIPRYVLRDKEDEEDVISTFFEIIDEYRRIRGALDVWFSEIEVGYETRDKNVIDLNKYRKTIY